MNIKLHIERLVLDGIPIARADRPRLQATIEAELSRLLAVGGVHPGLHGGSVLPSISASAIQLAVDSGPDGVGQQIARAVYGGIGK